MTGKEIYKIYAPEDVIWSDWVRPVPFVAIDTYKRQPSNDWVNRETLFLNEYKKDTALFIDLLGKESIELGIALANIGYRPIPVFNGTDEQNGSSPTTDTYLVERTLINGAEKLKKIKLDKYANPVFLLDSSRMNQYRAKESMFDNSWDLYKQDVPTADYFLKNNIKKIIIVAKETMRDLRKIFFEFQDKGIEIYLTDGYVEPKKVILKKTIKERLEKEEL